MNSAFARSTTWCIMTGMQWLVQQASACLQPQGTSRYKTSRRSRRCAGVRCPSSLSVHAKPAQWLIDPAAFAQKATKHTCFGDKLLDNRCTAKSLATRRPAPAGVKETHLRSYLQIHPGRWGLLLCADTYREALCRRMWKRSAICWFRIAFDLGPRASV